MLVFTLRITFQVMETFLLQSSTFNSFTNVPIYHVKASFLTDSVTLVHCIIDSDAMLYDTLKENLTCTTS